MSTALTVRLFSTADAFFFGNRLIPKGMTLRFYCLLLIALLSAGNHFTSDALCFAQELPAFPGAKGHGAATPGGSGRHLSPPRTSVLRVTSLADSGPGTLRACAEAKAPRICVFEVSGVIVQREALRIAAPYISIAGQTAPSPGIALAGAGLEISAQDVVIQHIEVRPGDGPEGPKPASRDGISIRSPARRVLIDHVSVSWAVDENVSTAADGVSDITISNSIIAEALYRSVHPDGPHSMGMLIGDNSKNITVHGCLFAHNFDRNPRLKSGARAEFLNNFVYHWGGKSGWNGANLSDTTNSGQPVFLNFEGNYYKPGPDSPKASILFARPPDSGTRIFVGENIGPGRESNSQNAWDITELPAIHRAEKRIAAASGAAAAAPQKTAALVPANAGSRPAERNDVDLRLVREAKDGTGSFRDCLAGCSRAVPERLLRPSKTETFLIPSAPHNDHDHDGYTNLEEVLQDMARRAERK